LRCVSRPNGTQLSPSPANWPPSWASLQAADPAQVVAVDEIDWVIDAGLRLTRPGKNPSRWVRTRLAMRDSELACKISAVLHAAGSSAPDRRIAAWNCFEEVVMSFLAELWSFMRVRKKFWLLPILIMMVLLGGLIVLTKGSAVAPFIYALF
jgi:hypothetical protein